MLSFHRFSRPKRLITPSSSTISPSSQCWRRRFCRSASTAFGIVDAASAKSSATRSASVKAGSVRSAVGLGYLLYEGIGDTIRVSLSGDSKEEIVAGYEILKSLNLRDKGATLIACPSCGRADVDVIKLANTVDMMLQDKDYNVRVAVMGCEVNGPGEAKDADVGIAAGVGRAVIFRRGQKARVVEESEMISALMEEVEKVALEKTAAEHHSEPIVS